MADCKTRTDRDVLNQALIATWKQQNKVKSSIEESKLKKEGTNRDELKRAQKQITVWKRQHSLIKSLSEVERAATAAKTARLRSLRLAKEEVERAEQAAKEHPPEQARWRTRKMMNTERSHP